MAIEQDIAWTVYSTVFVMLFVVLVARCYRHNMLLLPFILFTLMTLLALVISLARRYQGDAVLLIADRSPVVNHLPIFSLLLYAGLVESQLVHFAGGAQQHNDNDDDGTGNDEKRAWWWMRAWGQTASASAWTVVVLLAVYCALTVAHVVIMLLLDDNQPGTRLWLAMTVSGLVAVALVTTAWFATRSARKIKGAAVLAVLHALFLVFAVGMALAAWLLYDMIDRPPHLLTMTTPQWVMMESMIVYLPLDTLLALAAWAVRPHQHHHQPGVAGPCSSAYSPRILGFVARRTRFSNV